MERKGARTLMRYKYNPPLLIKKMFSDFIWETSNNKVLLTFDDGPNPGTTEIIINELDKYNAKAIFFCVGNNIKKYPNLSKEIIAGGHIIGNHTFNHKIITKLSSAEIEEEILKFNDACSAVLDIIPKYFRPPHGKFNLGLQKILSKHNLKNVMWSLLTYDYKDNLDLVRDSSLKYLKRDSVVVLHDSIKSKGIISDAIKIIIDEIGRRGYELGEPEECLK